ncbi:hypothetical protein [Kitasatospora griseola]
MAGPDGGPGSGWSGTCRTARTAGARRPCCARPTRARPGWLAAYWRCRPRCWGPRRASPGSAAASPGAEWARRVAAQPGTGVEAGFTGAATDPHAVPEVFTVNGRPCRVKVR